LITVTRDSTFELLNWIHGKVLCDGRIYTTFLLLSTLKNKVTDL